MNIADFTQRLKKAKHTHNGQYIACCPAHDDRKESLSITTGDDGRILLKCHAGCTPEAIVAAMNLTMNDLFPEEKHGRGRPSGTPVVYRYLREDQALAGEKVRYPDKRFVWRTKTAEQTWAYRKPSHCPLYNLPAAMKAKTVFVVEGEKDVDTLTRFGLTAVCSPDGAGPGKWLPLYSEALKGKEVIILPDNDTIGRAYAEEEANALLGIASSVRLLNLRSLWPDIPEHADISDYISRTPTFSGQQLLDFAAEQPVRTNKTLQGSAMVESVTELLKRPLQPIQFVVYGLLPHGLTVLCSPPKYGKSWFVLDLCLSAAAGKDFLGYKTKGCGTLYLSLEDSPNRLAQRVKKVTGGQNIAAGFYYATQFPGMDDGLLAELEKTLDAHPDIRLVVIDTLQKIRSVANYQSNSYAYDYQEIGQLKTFADEKNICLLLVHHTRKMGDESDAVNRISGTAAISGAADAIIVLSRTARLSETTTLTLTGRDVVEQEVVLQFDKDACRWASLGDAYSFKLAQARREYDASELVRVIKYAVDTNNGCWKGSIGELNAVAEQLLGYELGQPRKLSAEVDRISDGLSKYDDILHTAPSNGTGGRIHEFRKATASRNE